MLVASIEPPTLARFEQAGSAINAAYNAIAVDRGIDELANDVSLARGYVNEARDTLLAAAGHDGSDDARTAARTVLPKLDRAVALLNAMAVTHDVQHLTPLLDELGIALDHVEAVLAGAGWD